MSTQKSKLASDELDSNPRSGEHPAALRYPADPPRRLSDALRDPRREEPEPLGFSGTCQNASLADWIQLVQMGRRDAVIGVRTHDGRKGMLWCHDGDIVDAWCDGLLGEDAVYLALSWEGGQVSVAFVACERPRQIQLATAALLLRAAYRRDSGVRELSRAQRIPSTPAAPRTLSAPQAVAVRSTPPPSPSAPPSLPAESMAQTIAAPTPSPRRRIRRRLAALLGVALVASIALALSLTRSSSQPIPRHEGAPQPTLITPEAKRTSIPANPAPNATPAAAEPAAAKIETKHAAPSARRALPTSRSVAVPQSRNTNATALEVVAKPPPKAAKGRPGPQIIEDHAPRVQIIDERDSQIEVIQ